MEILDRLTFCLWLHFDGLSCCLYVLYPEMKSWPNTCGGRGSKKVDKICQILNSIHLNQIRVSSSNVKKREIKLSAKKIPILEFASKLRTICKRNTKCLYFPMEMQNDGYCSFFCICHHFDCGAIRSQLFNFLTSRAIFPFKLENTFCLIIVVSFCHFFSC